MPLMLVMFNVLPLLLMMLPLLPLRHL
jgi:hypothetical protein